MAWRPAWIWTDADSIHWLFFVAFYTVLANIPFWTAREAFGLAHYGVFCLEYAAVGLLALLVPRVLAAALLLLMVAADLLCGVCQTYYLSVRECVTNLSVFHALSGPRRHAAVAVMLLTLLVSAIAACLPAPSVGKHHRWRAAACLIAFLFVLPSLDCFTIVRRTGHFPCLLGVAKQRDRIELSLFSAVRFSRVPIDRLILIELGAAKVRKSEIANQASKLSVPSAAGVASRYAGFSNPSGGRETPDLVIVLVESWGLATDSSLNDALVQPYSEPGLRARYEVVQGTVPFYGGTVAGEARELCGNLFGFHLLNASTTELRGCLPERLAALGYNDIAVHGMDGHMFARSTWYSRIGFRETWFNDQLKEQGLPDCPGALIGTCDAAVADWIGRRLAEPHAKPYFVHWVTLNSHLPVLVPSPLPDGAPCSFTLGLTPQSALCSWYQLVANVHRSVSQLAMAKLVRPTIFVIVGDHAPPFGDPALRSRFSQDVVPYVLLAPRAEIHPPNSLQAHNSFALGRAAERRSPQVP
ncbi:MAG: sulfatase-like hydrolase/transferase [Terracidiphilus sp.]